MTGFDLIVFGAFAAMALGPAARGGTLTIDQAVAIAQSRAFAVQLQQSGLLRENSVVRQAESQLGPTLQGTASLSRAGQTGTSFVGGAATGTTTGGTTGTTGGTTGTTTGTTGGTIGTTASTFAPTTSTYGLVLSLPIDVSGALRANLRSAEATRRSQQQNVVASLNDARLNARTYFLALLRAKANVAVEEQSLANAQAQAEQARLQLEQVQVAKIDVDRLNAAVAQSESDLIDARTQYELARYQLNFALARPIDTPVDPVEVEALPDNPVDALALDQAARSSRPETRAAREAVRARSELLLAAKRGSSIPNLSVNLSEYRFGSDLGFNNTTNSTSVGVSVSFPIFDSGNLRAIVGQYRQDYEQARIQLAQTELTVSQDVLNAASNLRGARARLNNATRQVELAQEVFRIAEVRQRAGAGTYVEVVDAQTTLTTARQNDVRARYDVLTAFSQLQHAVGNDRLPTRPTVTPIPAGAPQ